MADRLGEVVVLGLGRFGATIAETLIELHYEVLGIDSDPRVVEAYSTSLTHLVEADATDAHALRQLGVADFHTAVVAIGDIEASILTTANLADLGIPSIWSKAITDSHGKILERVGAHHVVSPEREMGVRLAHAVTERMIDFVQLDAGFALLESRAPAEFVGKTLAQTQVRKRYGLTVVCIKPKGGTFTYATPDTVVGEGDILVVAGEIARTHEFADRALSLPLSPRLMTTR
ncbi:MAG: potassium channel family protein [Solirubrobacteraceae bacterium]